MPNAPVDHAAADRLWQAYRAAHPDIANDPEPPSVEQFGDHPTGRPRAILRSTELRIGTFADADEAFAHDEGEDDRTLASWRENHRRYWQRVAPRLGFEWTEEHEIILERFDVVWRADD